MGFRNMLMKQVENKVKQHVTEYVNSPKDPKKDGKKYDNPNTNLPPLEVQIYCHNVRQDAKDLMEGEQPWNDRREGVCANIYFSSQKFPTIVGLQEVKHNQLHDILYGLGKDWKYYGIGRDDGKTKGEFAPILYQDSVWKLKKGVTFWLSDKPDHPNKGWDAKCPRIVTVATLEHKQTKNVISVFNTHYDHKGKQARINSSKQIMNYMKTFEGVSVLCGDLNSESHEEAYKTFVQGGLLETAQHCKEKCGHKYTDTGFKKGREEKSIDFIWGPPNLPIVRHEVLESVYKGVKCSDHRPVTAVFSV